MLGYQFTAVTVGWTRLTPRHSFQIILWFLLCSSNTLQWNQTQQIADFILCFMPSHFCVHRRWPCDKQACFRGWWEGKWPLHVFSNLQKRQSRSSQLALASDTSLFFSLFSTWAIHVFLEWFWGSLNNNTTVANRASSWVIRWNTNGFSSIVKGFFFFCLQFKCLRSVLHQGYFCLLRTVGSPVRVFKRIKMLQAPNSSLKECHEATVPFPTFLKEKIKSISGY